MREYKIIKKYKGYTIAKNKHFYSIFTSDFINSSQPIYTYFDNLKETEDFIDNL